MRRVPIVRRRNDAVLSQKQSSFQYFLPDSSGFQLQVCQTMFCNVFGVKNRRLIEMQKKIRNGDFLCLDKRGSHENRPHKIPANVKIQMLDHIHSFPSYLGHYCREENNPLQEYLSPELNVRKMFDLFKAAYGPEADNWLWLYRVMLRETGLKFGKIRSDTCDLCDRLFIQISSLEETEDNAEQLQEAWQLMVEHHLAADTGYRFLHDDNELSMANDTIHTICIDLQGILLSPRLTNTAYYYQRKFMSYNLAIHSPSLDTTTMCFWNQIDAKRGSCEVGSCLLNYVATEFEPLEQGHERVLNNWSDRCSGQNNNYFMICLFKYLIFLNYFSEINQKFMTTGHSFLPCDRQFALIEKAKQGATIYTPDDFFDLIKQTTPTFKMQRMTRPTFNNIKVLEQYLPRPATLQVSKCMHIRITNENPNQIFTKDNHDSQQWTTHDILNPMNLHDLELPPCYLENLPISPPLIKDLQNMQQYIPPEKRIFWTNVLPVAEDQVVPQ